jgi:hypothetical protein
VPSDHFIYFLWKAPNPSDVFGCSDVSGCFFMIFLEAGTFQPVSVCLDRRVVALRLHGQAVRQPPYLFLSDLAVWWSSSLARISLQDRESHQNSPDAGRVRIFIILGPLGKGNKFA